MSTNIKLNAHKKNVHSNVENLYTCDYCSGSYRTIGKYKSHIIEKHAEKVAEIESNTDIKFPKCNLCHKLFNRGSALKYHTAAHEKKHLFCRICLKLFATSGGLRKHVQIKHGTESKEKLMKPDQTTSPHKPELVSKTPKSVVKSQGMKKVKAAKHRMQKKEIIAKSTNMNSCAILKPEIESFVDLDKIDYATVLAKDLEHNETQKYNHDAYRTINVPDNNTQTNAALTMGNAFLNEGLISADNLDRGNSLTTLLNVLHNTTSVQCQPMFQKF